MGTPKRGLTFSTVRDVRGGLFCDRIRARQAAVAEEMGTSERGPYPRRGKAEILMAIHKQRGAVRAYASLWEAEDDLAPA